MDDIIKPKELYEKYLSDRKAYEDRAEDISKYTLPTVFPSSSASSTTPVNDSYGARYSGILINSLAANISLALLPPSGSSFKFEPDREALAKLTEGSQANKDVIMKELVSVSVQINKELASQNIRPSMQPMLQNLIISGPVVVEKIEKNGIRVHGLRSFTVQLSSTNEPLKINLMEEIDPIELPEDVEYEQYENSETVELYTSCVKQRDGSWILYQSVNDGEPIVEESYKDYLDLPYTYLGWDIQSGDKYHRPMAENYLGIISDYEDINRVVIKGSIAASKVLLLVNPLGTTEKKDVANSANGAVIDGRQDDIGSFQLGKNYDFQTALQRLDSLERQLDRAFMSRQGTQRDAERVTAEEIRANAEDLDKDKAGIYSILSDKFTKWLINQTMKEINVKFKAIDVNIITGLDALGRNIESRKLDGYVSRLMNYGADNYIKKGELAIRYASYEGVDTEGLIKSDDEVAAEIKAQQDAMAQQQLMESGAKSLGQRAGENLGGNQ